MKVQLMTVEAKVKFKVLSNDDNIDIAIDNYLYIDDDNDGEHDLFKDFKVLDWTVTDYDKKTVEIDEDDF